MHQIFRYDGVLSISSLLQAIDRIKEEGVAAGKEANVESMKLDLPSLESTKKFIEDFKQKNLPLHLLICNAGIALVLQGMSQVCRSQACSCTV